ncbi:succinylglutamate desuccinylase/aspartoacylase domain-containing protein [uncultured Allomuricauda sp.]|uniref:succinylglutamate desuccinylase/aspartoacylase family protein n=1 Tax=Flagellimonas sp. W118 TaxID=3410791 RepID=UPI0026036840|nr:succinylglutamate desuccinylase/aspartoacylase family protein [uncultured Allomuricauda sp.]
MSILQASVKEPVCAQRLIGHVIGKGKGPTLVFFAGIHGNEHAGVLALNSVLKELERDRSLIKGEIYAIAGNLKALAKNVRFQTEDLNRIWIPKRIEEIQSKNGECGPEEEELLQLNNLLLNILANGKPPFYFIDLHTTSSDTIPFVVLNDSLLNRKFASNYPLPIILGIEEYLEGALLSYINDMGYVSLGYESGQHDDPKAVENCKNFIRYTLCLTETVDLKEHQKPVLMNKNYPAYNSLPIFYEIYYQHLIESKSEFRMLPGFVNFQHIPKGTSIAYYNGTVNETLRKRQIFMPLYQDQGSEGFYFIRSIPKVLLWFSKGLRRFKIDHLLVQLPGITWKSKEKGNMMVNQKIARFMAKSFFHLLGYRARQYDRRYMVIKSREIVSKREDYAETKWFKNKKRGPH